jgi:Helix-turn-helix domain
LLNDLDMSIIGVARHRASCPVTLELKEGIVAAALTKGSRITGTQRSVFAAQSEKRYDSGESIRTIAQDAGRSYGFVHRVLKEAGVVLRGRGGATRGAKTAEATPTKAPAKAAAKKSPAKAAAKKSPAKAVVTKKAAATKTAKKAPAPTKADRLKAPAKGAAKKAPAATKSAAKRTAKKR